MASYIENKQMDLAFDFNLATAFIKATNTGLASTVSSQIRLSYKLVPRIQFATFLTNHDQDRVMSDLGSNTNKARVAASLLLTSPGVPFLYYGEEVGLTGQKPDEDIRRPMQWTAESNAGFTTAIPWEPVGPDYVTYNVASETSDSASILSTYRDLIHLRNDHAALRVGDMNLFATDAPGLFADLRYSPDETVIVLINLSKNVIDKYALSLATSPLAEGTYLTLPLMGTGPFANLTVAVNGSISAYLPVNEIPAYSTIILQLRQH